MTWRPLMITEASLCDCPTNSAMRRCEIPSRTSTLVRASDVPIDQGIPQAREIEEIRIETRQIGHGWDRGSWDACTLRTARAKTTRSTRRCG